MATSTGTSIWPVTLVIVRIMSRMRSIATSRPMPSSGRPAALSTSVTITVAVPGTPAVPKLPSTEANRITKYWFTDRSSPKYCATKIDVCEAYIDNCVAAHDNGELTAVEAAKAKWWSSQTQSEVIDDCVQIHGGYGFMNEYRVARAWRDARVTKIWAGSNEIMKELIGRELGF